jgi:hypothetical protein
VTIAAEPQAIWDVIADFGAISSWADIVDHSCLLTPGADGIAVDTTRPRPGRPRHPRRAHHRFDPPHALAYDVAGFPRQLHIKNRWTLTPTTGGALVSFTSTVEIGTNPLQRLAERIVGRVSAKQVESMLAGLTHRIERSRA